MSFSVLLAPGGTLKFYNINVMNLIDRAVENNATTLVVAGEECGQLPMELRQLSRLKDLRLQGMGLTFLPSWIGDFSELEDLDLSGNHLSMLPPTIGMLTKLRRLTLTSNLLQTLPEEIGGLANLETLHVNANRLLRLPDSVGKLNLSFINLAGNDRLADPPREIVENGTDAVLDYLRGRLDPTSTPQWTSKLIVIGEAAVGKTSLTRALAGEAVRADEPQTHGVRTTALEFDHPKTKDVRLRLHTWDFGGQQIYHATHRFFLTDRALFLLVWNCREGYSKGQMRKWLQAITARAPSSPIILVATHSDEHPADLPITLLTEEFPKIAASLYVDSPAGRGLDELVRTISKAAAGLPLMGQRWPRSWSQSRELLTQRQLTQPFASLESVRHDLLECGVTRASEQDNVLAVLHYLGELLHFPDDPDLREMVILAPKWVEGLITRLLDSRELLQTRGVLKRDLVMRLWSEEDSPIRNHLVAMMEQFDLAYRLDSDESDDICLVVEKLSENPVPLPAQWAEAAETGASEIRLVFDFSDFLSLQAGIPTWFIAREHRFTTGTHWKTGALFYSRQEDTWALVTANEATRKVELKVRGNYPVVFFSELKSGFERILTQRYPGVPYRLLVPCPCGRQDEKVCPHMFEYNHLRLRLTHHKEYIECPESLKDVHVRGLIEGFEPATLDDIRERIESVHTTVQGFEQQSLLAVDFLRHLSENRRAQEARCPAIFTVTQEREGRFRRRIMVLRFYCEQPNAWHPIEGEGNRIVFSKHPEWLVGIAPHLRIVVNILRILVPYVEPVTGVVGLTLDDRAKSEIQLMKELVDHLPMAETGRTRQFSEGTGPRRLAHTDGEFRVLERMLKDLDPSCYWGGLNRVTTPEGLTLYVCSEHLDAYSYPATPRAMA